MRKSKNYALLQSLTTYCLEHPEERLWQAIRNWSGADEISFTKYNTKQNSLKLHLDTFYFEDKNK